MKIEICDICLKEGRVNIAEEHIKLNHYGDLRISFCCECRDRIPKSRAEFIVFYSQLNDEEIILGNSEEVLEIMSGKKIIKIHGEVNKNEQFYC